ncbi:unnamed protein product [Malus baccata var. baccata]
MVTVSVMAVCELVKVAAAMVTKVMMIEDMLQERQAASSDTGPRSDTVAVGPIRPSESLSLVFLLLRRERVCSIPIIRQK